MANEELTIAAIAALMDEKLKPIYTGLNKIEARLDSMEVDVHKTKFVLENEINPRIQLLAENYVPAAKRFVQAADAVDGMKSEIRILQKVTAGHSKKLEKIS